MRALRGHRTTVTEDFEGYATLDSLLTPMRTTIRSMACKRFQTNGCFVFSRRALSNVPWALSNVPRALSSEPPPTRPREPPHPPPAMKAAQKEKAAPKEAAAVAGQGPPTKALPRQTPTMKKQQFRGWEALSNVPWAL